MKGDMDTAGKVEGEEYIMNGDMERECDLCEGQGRVPIGEHYVTRDMALDAGEPQMEGMSLGVEYGPCPRCCGHMLLCRPAERKALRALRLPQGLTILAALGILGCSAGPVEPCVPEVEQVGTFEGTDAPVYVGIGCIRYRRIP